LHFPDSPERAKSRLGVLSISASWKRLTSDGDRQKPSIREKGSKWGNGSQEARISGLKGSSLRYTMKRNGLL